MSAMRILVCFKVTPDYEALRDADWVAGPGDAVRSRYVRRVLNCFDESALELALRLREALAGRDVVAGLGALSVGGRETEPFFATLHALGYERAARIEPGAALDYAPTATAALIAGYARRVDRSDLLLLGSRCGPGDSGTVPLRVADELGWPCVTEVAEIEPRGRDGLRVTCAADDGRLSLTVRPPCVLAIGNALVSHLRVPTLSDRLARRELRADVLAPGDVGVDIAATLGATPAALEGLERIDRTRAGVLVEGDTPAEMARALFAAHVEGAIARP
jgi:electron transfer flavoprotein alpha/beta subunit